MADNGFDYIPFGIDGEDSDKGDTHDLPIALMTSASAPWISHPMMSSLSSSSKFIYLHNEILSFCELIAPSREDTVIRKKLLNELTEIVNETFPTASVHVFGSQYTGILTPSSDLDLAVLNVPGNSVVGNNMINLNYCIS
jgi:DNA polymerase sigma